jgi:hypothetical protein
LAHGVKTVHDDPDEASRYGGKLKANVCRRDSGIAIGPGILAYSHFCSLRSGRRFCTRSKHEHDVLRVVDAMPEVLEARLRPAIVSSRREQVDEFWFDAAAPEGCDRSFWLGSNPLVGALTPSAIPYLEVPARGRELQQRAAARIGWTPGVAPQRRWRSHEQTHHAR